MTDAPMFYQMFNILQESGIYYPKINNVDYYLDIVLYYNNDKLENAYQEFTRKYDKTEYEPLYYYIYIILLNDSHTNINMELYENIIIYLLDFYQINYTY